MGIGAKPDRAAERLWKRPTAKPMSCEICSLVAVHGRARANLEHQEQTRELVADSADFEAALDVYNMTSTDQWETEHIAAAIQRDPTLAAEVLRLANSSFYNPSGQRVAQLERAVVQIGQKRVGELSLATNGGSRH